jgi:hypothetical protein
MLACCHCEEGSDEAIPLRTNSRVPRHRHPAALLADGLPGDAYFIDLKDALKRDLGMKVPLAGSLHTLGLGATGLSCNQTNFIARTVRRYVDCYERGDPTAANRIYADLHRFNRFWSSGVARAGRTWR